MDIILLHGSTKSNLMMNKYLYLRTPKTTSKCQLLFSYQPFLVHLAFNLKLLKTHGDRTIQVSPHLPSLVVQISKESLTKYLPVKKMSTVTNLPICLSYRLCMRLNMIMNTAALCLTPFLKLKELLGHNFSF
jgi:hypothetical protein